MSLARRITRTLEERDDTPLLFTEETTLTAAALLRRGRLFARMLRWLEIPPAGVVAHLLPPGWEAVVVHLGCLLGGQVSFPLNPQLPSNDLEDLLARSDARLVVAPRALLEELARPEGLEPEGGALGPRLSLGAGPPPHALALELLESSLAGAARAPRRDGSEPGPADGALIVTTSGTTGHPKLVLHTQGSLEAGWTALAARWHLTADDHLYLALPLFHVHGLCLGIHGLLAGGHKVTLDRGFDARRARDVLGNPQRGITLFYGVPTHYRRLVREAEAHPFRLDPLRFCASGSAPLGEYERDIVAEKLGAPIVERYGLSEVLILTAQEPAGTGRAGAVGPPLDGVALRCVDGEGKPAARGEVQARTPACFARYVGDEEATARAFTPDGWFRTGDEGTWTEEGELRITGRLKDILISGGENVAPSQVERVLAALPGVEEVAVLGLPDPEWGERIVALVVPGKGFDRERFIEDGRRRLVPHQRPKEIRTVDRLPRNAMGKLDRSRLPEVFRHADR